MTIERNFFTSFRREILAATVETHSMHAPVHAISLHGAGPAGRERARYLTAPLAESGRPSLRFDYSGHGDSSGVLHDSSLQDRIDQTLHFTKYLDRGHPLIVIGTSMGGHIAARMTETWNVGVLVLITPAAYSLEAETAQFGEPFTIAIRRPDSWQTSPAFEALRGYRNRALLITCGNDQVIPPGVVSRYKDALSSSRLKCLHFPDGPHNIHGWLRERDRERQSVIAAVLEEASA